jgi:signal peptidase II
LSRKYKLAAIFCLVCLGLDKLTKILIYNSLGPGSKQVELIENFFFFRYAENDGIAFGLLQDIPEVFKIPLFSSIALVAVIIIWHLLKQCPKDSIRLPIALGLILSGAFGNLSDRFHWGFVVDFILVRLWPPTNYHWPTFNLADTFISIGIMILVFDTLFMKELEPELVEAQNKLESSDTEDDKGLDSYPKRPDNVSESG